MYNMKYYTLRSHSNKKGTKAIMIFKSNSRQVNFKTSVLPMNCTLGTTYLTSAVF